MTYASVNDIRRHDEDFGNPAATPLILLHGGSGAIDSPASGRVDHRAAFSERYRAIHLEHRGHGRTNHPAVVIRDEMIADDGDSSSSNLAPRVVCHLHPWIVGSQVLDVLTRNPS